MTILSSINTNYVPDAEHVGGKAHGLFMMEQMGLKVPEFIVVPCSYSHIQPDPDMFTTYLKSALRHQFAPTTIFSVRSGAPISMPGMMDTLLNLGITDDNFSDVVIRYGKSAASNIYARLVRQFSVFEGMDDKKFAEVENAVNVFYGILDPADRNQALLDGYKNVRKRELPSRNEQIVQAVKWVWESYNSERAIAYREINNIPHNIGTAVVIQRMVFGNLSERCGTGVAFSHNPNTGEKTVMGDFLINGQGEEVVSGTINTIPIARAAKMEEFVSPIKMLRKRIPEIIKAGNYGMLDIEFTIEDGELYFLQVREAKCAPKAKVRLVVDKASSGELTSSDVVNQIMKMLPDMTFNNVKIEGMQIGTGIGAVEGQVTGKIATTHSQANVFHQAGVPFIYVAEMTEPTDLVPMSQAEGILTKVGGMLSHAALIAREWGKVAVVAFGEMEIISDTEITVNGETYDHISLVVEGPDGKVLT